MSGYALIYDKAGVDPFCLSAAYNQIKSLIDDRSYRVEYFSNASAAIDNSRSNPVPLFVIPGGNYREMADELEPLASRIHDLIVEEGSSYLGLCAGAIGAACHPLLLYNDTLTANQPNPMQEMYEVESLRGRSYLQLYSGTCSAFFGEAGEGEFITQQVSKVATEIEQEPYPLYFQSGVFFPSAAKEPDATPLLKYTSYRFSGFYRPGAAPQEVYENIELIAAVTQKAGKGKVLLSGVHPEIGPDVVSQFPVQQYCFTEKGKQKVIDTLRTSEVAQVETMREYLKALSIATKKV